MKIAVTSVNAVAFINYLTYKKMEKNTSFSRNYSLCRLVFAGHSVRFSEFCQYCSGIPEWAEWVFSFSTICLVLISCLSAGAGEWLSQRSSCSSSSVPDTRVTPFSGLVCSMGYSLAATTHSPCCWSPLNALLLSGISVWTQILTVPLLLMLLQRSAKAVPKACNGQGQHEFTKNVLFPNM